MPAELIESTGKGPSSRMNGQGRARPLGLGRVGRVSRQARNAGHGVVEVVVGFKLLVGQRPVIGHAVQGLDPEVRRMKSGNVRAPMDRASADRVVHQRGDGRFGVVNRVVFGQPADVGIRMEVGLQPQLGIGLVNRERRLGRPAALLKADHFDACLAEAPRQRGSGSAGSDNQNICHVVVCHLKPRYG